MENSELNTLRDEIEETDREMQKLFIKRMAAAEKIADYKRLNNLPVYDAERERQLTLKLASQIDDELLCRYYHVFLNSVLEISKSYQYCLISEAKNK